MYWNHSIHTSEEDDPVSVAVGGVAVLLRNALLVDWRGEAPIGAKASTWLTATETKRVMQSFILQMCLFVT